MRDILVVEDGRQERERLEKLFKQAKFSVSTAQNAEEAERLLALEQFRVVFLDIELGGKSGSYVFELIKRSGYSPYVIILTGNPSLHLKQRFLEEGATAYVVKATKGAENQTLLEQVHSLIGSGQPEAASGMPLGEFLKYYVNESSRELFLDEHGDFPPCGHCGAREYLVSFAHKTQLPPVVEGVVICALCKRQMDLEVK